MDVLKVVGCVVGFVFLLAAALQPLYTSRR